MCENPNGCPKCGGRMNFVSGPIDDECRVPDFVYCPDCNDYGYEPGDTSIIVVKLKEAT